MQALAEIFWERGATPERRAFVAGVATKRVSEGGFDDA